MNPDTGPELINPDTDTDLMNPDPDLMNPDTDPDPTFQASPDLDLDQLQLKKIKK
jgi:hypothetical protein